MSFILRYFFKALGFFLSGFAGSLCHASSSPVGVSSSSVVVVHRFLTAVASLVELRRRVYVASIVEARGLWITGSNSCDTEA